MVREVLKVDTESAPNDSEMKAEMKHSDDLI